tara:strand:- start:449 stop:1264 length:816 start_codon:yes stop_codon:yes gene_type:complete
MKKVISFSLWGKSQMYNLGAVINADMAERLWPDWIARYYVASSVADSVIDELNKRDNTEVILMGDDPGWNGMFWRFLTASDPEVDIMISRDADSRINERDKAAVDQWLESGKKFHIIRDMCQHGWKICGGTWGVRDGFLRDISIRINDYLLIDKANNHGVDQRFLDSIYDYVVLDSFTHDEDFPDIMHPKEVKHKLPIPRLRGDGWWNTDFPEWHSGLEDNPDNYDWGEQGHCHLFCPACKTFHDNEYIGKTKTKINKSDIEKYSHLLEEH